VAHFVENGCRRRAIVGSFVHDIQHDAPLGLSNTGVFEEVVDKNLERFINLSAAVSSLASQYGHR
jgi:hypothetical protein